MSIMEMEHKARELEELMLMKEALQTAITAAEDEIIAAMGGQDQIVAGGDKITWKPATSNRVDTTALMMAWPDVAERFTVTSTCKRFQVA